jgi:hypothetical protein
MRNVGRKPILGQTTKALLALSAFLAAVIGFLSQVAPLRNAIASSWCAVLDCSKVSSSTKLPQAKAFTHSSFTTLDGEGAPSGTISNIRVTIVDNKGKQPDTYVVEWTWSSNAVPMGSQGGSQTVIVDLKSADGGTLQSLKIGLDRSHCYYGGNNERHEGRLSVAAILVAGILVSVSRVEGRQGRC